MTWKRSCSRKAQIYRRRIKTVSGHCWSIELFAELFGAIDEALDVFKKEKAEEQKKSDYSAVLFNEVINFFNLTRCETQLEKIRFNLDSTFFQGKFEPE